jgi:hypothetical protein
MLPTTIPALAPPESPLLVTLDTPVELAVAVEVAVNVMVAVILGSTTLAQRLSEFEL